MHHKQVGLLGATVSAMVIEEIQLSLGKYTNAGSSESLIADSTMVDDNSCDTSSQLL